MHEDTGRLTVTRDYDYPPPRVPNAVSAENNKDTDLTHLAARKLELDAGLSFLRAAAATAPSDKEPLDGGNAGPRKTGTQQANGTKPNAPVSSRKALHQTVPLPKSNISGGAEGASSASARGRSESPGRTAAAQVWDWPGQ